MEFTMSYHQGKQINFVEDQMMYFYLGDYNFKLLICSDVVLNGFCSEYCGWHYYIGDYKYASIGVPPSTGCGGCISQNPSPNGNSAVDSVVNVIAHELAEAATDPFLNAWWNIYGDENADICNKNFLGATYYGSFRYNIVVGGWKYLIQSNYNLATKVCSMN